jgi:ArsR family transcriptional regulator, virulence genes transcriptional regulator
MPYGHLLQTAGRASRLLKALGNERRLAILCHLSEREHSVTELCRLVGLSQSALSQHLAKLRRDNLVRTRRAAQTVYYSLGSHEVEPLLRSLTDVFGPAAANKAATAGDGARERPCGAAATGDRSGWPKQNV